MVEEITPTQQQEETLASFLKSARLKQDKTFAEIEAFLRVKEKYLLALENGEYDSFPALVYGLAFLRSYAKFLNIDEKKATYLFKQETAHLETAPAELPSMEVKNGVPSGKLLIILFVCLVFASALWYFESVKKDTQQEEVLHKLAEDISFASQPSVETDNLLKVDLSIIQSDTQDNQLPLQEVQNEINQSIQSVDVDLETSKTTSEPSDDTPDQSQEVSQVQSEVSTTTPLLFVAQDNVWIEVSKNGKVIFNKVLKNGESYAPNDTDLVLRTGNAKKLRVYVKDEDKGFLNPTKAVVKNIPLSIEYFEKVSE